MAIMLQITLYHLKKQVKLGNLYDKMHWICYDIANVEKPSYEGYKLDEGIYENKVTELMAIAGIQ